MRKKRTCCVANCTSSRSPKEGLIMHTFPVNENRRREWMNACNIDKSKLYLGVCSKHFKKEDYLPCKYKVIISNETIINFYNQFRPILSVFRKFFKQRINKKNSVLLFFRSELFESAIEKHGCSGN